MAERRRTRLEIARDMPSAVETLEIFFNDRPGRFFKIFVDYAFNPVIFGVSIVASTISWICAIAYRLDRLPDTYWPVFLVCGVLQFMYGISVLVSVAILWGYVRFYIDVVNEIAEKEAWRNRR